MLRTRIIPCLQLIDNSLVKTIRFKKYNYIGDPINTVRIFNELEVDELCFLDIRATQEKRSPNFKLLAEIANECFMPLSYGGGIKEAETARKILSIGFEKVVINSSVFENPTLITEITKISGNQSVICSIDVKKNMWGKYSVYKNDGSIKTKFDPLEWAIEMEKRGAGELLITSMDNDGLWSGFDIQITKTIAEAVSIPVIANGGGGSIIHIGQIVKEGSVSAVALGSMVVYQQKGMGVLVNFPDKIEIDKVIA